MDSSKHIKWTDMGIMHPQKALQRLLKLPVSSKIKSFAWLLVNHALPVRDRYFGNAEHTCHCTCCSSRLPNETISHALSGCPVARKIITAVNAEWGTRFPQSLLKLKHVVSDLLRPSSKPDIDEEDKVTRHIYMLFDTLALITYHSIWVDRSSTLFKRVETPPLEVANRIWRAFTLTVEAYSKDLRDKIEWWTNRHRLNLAGRKTTKKKLKAIRYAIRAANMVLNTRQPPVAPIPYYKKWYLHQSRITTLVTY